MSKWKNFKDKIYNFQAIIWICNPVFSSCISWWNINQYKINWNFHNKINNTENVGVKINKGVYFLP